MRRAAAPHCVPFEVLVTKAWAFPEADWPLIVGFAGAQLRPCALSNYIYEQRLLRKIRRQSSPRHVGIILHGNRRHGRSLGLTDPQAIYRLGAQKLGHMLGWCAELSIPAVTLWVFSTDNLQRPPVEVTGIFGAIETKMAALASHPRPEPPPSP